ncbi:MAG: hypothetical protein CMK59_06055 [Proteobacteria bacterium]|nr:hypothetical protein [Pseudomonadota bacterium]|tara:strand:- start:260 stop:757 length:498 start_codon:yes stop_codon:yes gene_type:complete
MEIQAVSQWIEHFVLKHNLCPFAHKPFKEKQIEYVVIQNTSIPEILQELLDCCERLQQPNSPQTLLLILKSGFDDFEDYLDLFELSEDLLKMEILDETFQLASFHPKYCFDGLAYSDPANLTNRAPYPLIHILRCSDVEQAISQHPNTLDIPERNIKILRALFRT